MRSSDSRMARRSWLSRAAVRRCTTKNAAPMTMAVTNAATAAAPAVLMPLEEPVSGRTAGVHKFPVDPLKRSEFMTLVQAATAGGAEGEGGARAWNGMG
jgi:hypothetical protein